MLVTYRMRDIGNIQERRGRSLGLVLDLFRRVVAQSLEGGGGRRFGGGCCFGPRRTKRCSMTSVSMSTHVLERLVHVQCGHPLLWRLRREHDAHR